MLTAYDSTMARIIDGMGIDIILVGDSAGNIMLGYENTIPVTMDDMIRFTAAVVRSTNKSFIIGDMPFMSYEVSAEEATRNAGRFIKEAGAMAVKLEGGSEMKTQISAIIDSGIPVCGHLGLTPQSIHKFGGFKVQARTAEAARSLIEDSLALQEAGIFLLVLEGIPWQVAKLVTECVSIPTIGIGFFNALPDLSKFGFEEHARDFNEEPTSDNLVKYSKNAKNMKEVLIALIHSHNNAYLEQFLIDDYEYLTKKTKR